jgi:hypothetical protein
MSEFSSHTKEADLALLFGGFFSQHTTFTWEIRQNMHSAGVIGTGTIGSYFLFSIGTACDTLQLGKEIRNVVTV